MKDLLNGYRLILGSSSPRRSELLKKMGLPFELRPIDVEENYPSGLQAAEIPAFLCRLKARAYTHPLEKGEILLTADTVVWYDGKVLGKPKDAEEARDMLKQMSAATHQVYTGVCFKTREEEIVSTCETRVVFRELSVSEIDYYVKTFSPVDKAGAYGIQEWIGYVGIESIEGSYPNVVGLPTHLVYNIIRSMVG